VKTPTPKSSLPTGKDESQLVTVVRQEWEKYKGQEKRFSKAFAEALIHLQKKLAKPGYGKFVAYLKGLNIPTSTAYRVMRLHGWKPEKQTDRSPKPGPDAAGLRSKLCKLFRVYLGAASSDQCTLLTTELLLEIYPDREIKVTIE
jgi:hypothetical protein